MPKSAQTPQLWPLRKFLDCLHARAAILTDFGLLKGDWLALESAFQRAEQGMVLLVSGREIAVVILPDIDRVVVLVEADACVNGADGGSASLQD
jgi:hypothetical protein